jgi:hypothetical protein
MVDLRMGEAHMRARLLAPAARRALDPMVKPDEAGTGPQTHMISLISQAVHGNAGPMK